MMEVTEVPSGTELARIGQTPTKVYCLLEGVVTVSSEFSGIVQVTATVVGSLSCP